VPPRPRPGIAVGARGAGQPGGQDTLSVRRMAYGFGADAPSAPGAPGVPSGPPLPPTPPLRPPVRGEHDGIVNVASDSHVRSTVTAPLPKTMVESFARRFANRSVPDWSPALSLLAVSVHLPYNRAIG